MLEYAFYAYFKERGADLALIAYQRVGVGKGQAQVELIQALSERKLVC